MPPKFFDQFPPKFNIFFFIISSLNDLIYVHQKNCNSPWFCVLDKEKMVARSDTEALAYDICESILIKRLLEELKFI